MRRIAIAVTLVAGVFVGGTMSASANEAKDSHAVILETNGHDRQHIGEKGEGYVRAAADGICTAYYAMMGIKDHPRED